mmetsp:Transcript_8508/g.19930  ORF Transcript_8508/g.19930 Transcript_8508/m.19930 type:complete len:252 (-) Transcript_8508:674-1429(-)
MRILHASHDYAPFNRFLNGLLAQLILSSNLVDDARSLVFRVERIVPHLQRLVHPFGAVAAARSVTARIHPLDGAVDRCGFDGGNLEPARREEVVHAHLHSCDRLVLAGVLRIIGGTILIIGEGTMSHNVVEKRCCGQLALRRIKGHEQDKLHAHERRREGPNREHKVAVSQLLVHHRLELVLGAVDCDNLCTYGHTAEKGRAHFEFRHLECASIREDELSAVAERPYTRLFHDRSRRLNDERAHCFGVVRQ